MIDEKEVTAYVTIPDCFLQGCSEDIVIFRADGGNHFTDYGIYEGMFLFFDRKKRFKKGRLSCYINTAGAANPHAGDAGISADRQHPPLSPRL